MTAVAIIMPFKNAAPFVRQAVDSILSQSFSDFRLVAVDDHSVDSTAAILAAYRGPRIAVIQSRAHGVAEALNVGLLNCQGTTLVARHDADDISLPDRLARQVAAMKEDRSIDMLATQAERIDEEGRFLRAFPATPTTHCEVVAALKSGNPICHGSVMFRPGPVMAVGGYNARYPVAQGYELWVRMARAGYRFAALPDVLYLYRTYEKSWSRSQAQLRDELIERIRRAAEASL